LQSNVNSKAMGRKSRVAAAETARKLSELAEKGAVMARAIGRKVQGAPPPTARPRHTGPFLPLADPRHIAQH
jgi:hypothetical protein